MKSVRLHGRERERGTRGRRGGTREKERERRRQGEKDGLLGAPAGDVRKGTSCLELHAAPGVTTTVSSAVSSFFFFFFFLSSFPFSLQRRDAARERIARTSLISPFLGHYLYANEKAVKRRDIGLPWTPSTKIILQMREQDVDTVRDYVTQPILNGYRDNESELVEQKERGKIFYKYWKR